MTLQEEPKTDELYKLLNRLIHCQKMVDFGAEGWDEFGDELNVLLLDKIPAYLHRQTRKAEWSGRVSEAAWWHRNYQNPKYKELLAKRYEGMKARLKELEKEK